MSALDKNIQNWFINETNGLIDGGFRFFPDISAISKLTEGKNKKIWKFVVKHVQSKQSVVLTRKLLHLRRAKKERERYSIANEESHVVLQNKVDIAEDKVQFAEHTTKNVTKHISSLHTSVKNKKEENCILNQKCTILELAYLNLKEKNELLIVITDQLFALLNKSFANDKTKCFMYPVVPSSSKCTMNQMKNIKLNDDFLNSILNEMMLVVKKKLLSEDTNLPVTNLIFPLTEIMNCTLTADIVTQLKQISQQDSNFLQNNIEKPTVGKIERLSETYLQSMKQDLVESCFHRKKLGCKIYPLEINKMHFNKDCNELQQDYLSLHIQNECLADSIQYLEKQLASELEITENLMGNNTKLKSQCKDIEIIIGDFYKNLSAFHGLLNLLPQTYKSITLSLESCQKFIDSQIYSTIKCNKDNCFNDLAIDTNCDFELSLELLKSKEFLQDISKDFTFTKLDFPAKVWEFLSLKPFHNKHLVIEKLAFIKRSLSIKPKQLCYVPDEMPTSTSKMLFSVEENTDNMEFIMRNLFDAKKSCKKLEIVLEDWWNQNAQYIPAFEYRGKTLKMWLALLNVIEF